MNKELRVRISVKNNILLKKREQLGMTQTEISKILNISTIQYSQFECLRANPKMANGEWRDLAFSISSFFKCEPEELWPETIVSLKARTKTIEISPEEFIAISAPGPQLAIESREMKKEINSNLKILTPPELFVIKHRFGLDGETVKNLAEIGRIIPKYELCKKQDTPDYKVGNYGRKFYGRTGLTRSRVREIELKAIHKLRTCKSSKIRELL